MQHEVRPLPTNLRATYGEAHVQTSAASALTRARELLYKNQKHIQISPRNPTQHEARRLPTNSRATCDEAHI